MPKISIVVPIYNVELFLRECLQSIADQSFLDWEAILVNNGSTDSSPRIIEEFAQKDKRFQVITLQPNRGLSGARNAGVEQAKGEYVFFLDADDFLLPHACEVLYREAKAHDLDVAMADFYEYDHVTKKQKPFPRALRLPYTKAFVDKTQGDSVRAFMEISFAIPFAWGKLIRRSLLEQYHLRFYPGAVEDVPFSAFLFAVSQKVKMLENEYILCYRTNRPGNLSRQQANTLLGGIVSFARLEQDLKRLGVFDEVKELFWFNKMVLLIGDEKLFVGRMGNVAQDAVAEAYKQIQADMAQLDVDLFRKRNFLFCWKVKALKKAVSQNDLTFPRRLRKMRNIAMIFLDPFYKLSYRVKQLLHGGF